MQNREDLREVVAHLRKLTRGEARRENHAARFATSAKYRRQYKFGQAERNRRYKKRKLGRVARDGHGGI